MTELILLSLKIRSRGLAALVWCYVRRNVITGNRTFSGHTTHVSIMCSLHLFCTVRTVWWWLLAYLRRQKVRNPRHRERVGTSVFAAEQLVVLCYWLVGYAFAFLIGCRFWVCFFTRVDAGMAFWRLAGCQFVAQCSSVCRGEWWDAVGRGSGGVLRHLSGLLQVMCAQVRGSQPGPQGMPSCAVAMNRRLLMSHIKYVRRFLESLASGVLCVLSQGCPNMVQTAVNVPCTLRAFIRR